MRLIDADALMGEVESVLLMYSQFNHWLTKDMYTRMKIAVRAMPTIDAVLVVRCRQCIYFRKGYCVHPAQDMIPVMAGHFCGYGERKDGE